MGPEGRSGEGRAEETADWPATPRPAPPSREERDEEATQAASVTPRSLHEENTLEAARFVRPSQPHPLSQPFPPNAGPASQAPGWPPAPAPPGGSPWGGGGGAANYPPGQPGPPGTHPPHSHPGPPVYPGPGLAGPSASPPPTGPFTSTKPQLTAAQRLSKYRWWLIGGAAALVAILVIAVVVASSDDDSASTTATSAARVPAGPTTTARVTPSPSASGPAAPAPPPPAAPAPAPAAGPVLPPDALPGLLLPADQISQRLNIPGMTGTDVVRTLMPGTVTPPNCFGAWGPAYQATYSGSGHTGSALQLVTQESGPGHVAQAVISFPDAAAARGFYDRQVADWNACKSTHIVYSAGGGSTEADLGVPSVSGDMITLTLVPTTAKTAGQQCERDMTVRGNVIVDVRACSPTVGSAGYSIARDIADKIR